MIRIRETGALVSDNDFRALHQTVSFPTVLDRATLDHYGADPVMESPAPTVGDFQTAVMDGAYLAPNAVWMTHYTVTNWPQEQIDEYKLSGKFDRWEAIKAERDRREAGGVLVGVKWFHSDQGSRIKQLGLVIAGAAIPSGLQWKTMDGSFVTMTQTLATQVFGTSLAATSSIFAKAEQHRVLMEASPNPTTYDFSKGWPKIYGE